MMSHVVTCTDMQKCIVSLNTSISCLSLLHLISSFYLANSVLALSSAELIFIFDEYKIVSVVSELNISETVL